MASIFYPIIWVGGFLYLVYLVWCVWGLIHTFVVDKGKNRRLRIMVIVASFFGLLPVLLYVVFTYHTMSQISGNYKGTLGGGTDTFSLRPDGTFSQRFMSGTGHVYASSGRWRITQMGFGPVNFDNIILPIDSWGKRQAPKVSTFHGADLNSSQIWLSHDDDDEDSSVDNSIHRIGP